MASGRRACESSILNPGSLGWSKGGQPGQA